MKLSTLKLAVLGALLTPMTSVFAEEAPAEVVAEEKSGAEAAPEADADTEAEAKSA